MNRKTSCLTDEQFDEIINILENGTPINTIRPNKEMALILTITGNCGLRIGDCLNLTMNSFIKEKGEYKYNIKEDKTNKIRSFMIPDEIYQMIESMAKTKKLALNDKVFEYTERAIQKKLKQIREYLGEDYANVSTHSFRKCAAMRIYNASGKNIELTRKFLNHSNIAVTQKYLGVTDDEVNNVIRNSVHISMKGA